MPQNMYDGVFCYLFYVVNLTPESLYFLVVVKLLKVVLLNIFESVNGENKRSFRSFYNR